MVLLLLQCCLFHNTCSYDYDSQSQENNSELDAHHRHHHHHHWTRNNDYNTRDNDDECSNCACNKCDNPPDCCKKVCEICPKLTQRPQTRRNSIPRIEIIPMPGMPPMPLSPPPAPIPLPPMPLPIPQMPQMPMPMPQMSMPPMSMPPMSMPAMPPMPHMSAMPMPQMSLPMPMPSIQMPMPMPGQFPNMFPNPSLVYFPLASNFMNFFKKMASQVSLRSGSTPALPVTTKAPTIVTVITTVPTIQTTTTTEVSTTVLTTQRQPIKPAAEDQVDDYRMENSQYLKSQRDDNAFESVIKSAIDDFSNIIVKTPEKNSDGNNKYMLISLRRTKPTWMPKFGIVPIPDNMAQRLMSQLRTVQGRRRRQKRMAIFM